VEKSKELKQLFQIKYKTAILKEILFLNTIAEFEQAKKLNLLQNKKIIAISYTVFYILEKNNIAAVPIWEYSTYNELLESLKRDVTIIEKFWFPFCQSNNYAYYAKVALFPLIYFLDEALVSSLLINKIIESENRGKIFYFTSHIKKPCIEGEWQGNVFDAMLEYHCQKNNIKYEKIYRESEKKFKKNKKSSKIQYILFYFIGLFLSLFLYPMFFLFKKKTAISLVSEKEKKTRLGWVYKKFHKHFKLFIINLWCYKTSKYISVYTDGFLTKLRDKKKMQAEYLTMYKKLFAYKESFELQPDILNNFFLTYQWEYIISVFCETIYNARRKAKRINRLFHPQTIIISQAHQPRTIALSKSFQKFGVKSFILHHATLPYNLSYFYDFHDLILVTGRYQYQKMLEFGIKSEKFFTINDERFKIKEINNNLTSLYKKYNIDNNKKIITIITRNTQAGASFFSKWDVRVSMEKTYNFLKACASLSDLGLNYHIIFKSHPLRDYYELYEEFAKTPNIQHIKNEPVEELLLISHLVIFVGPITDVLFEAGVRKKKIIICNSGLDKDLIELLQKDVIIVDKPLQLLNKVKIQMNSSYNNSPNTHIINEFLHIEKN